MDQTSNLKLPYILAAQSQKHVTHNEALRALDALVQLTVADKDLTAPPGSPAEGARYVVAASPTGGWAGQATKIAAYQDGAWAFYAPLEGWLAWVADEDAAYVFNGTAWIPLPGSSGGDVNPVPLVGVNATADSGNRLSVSSPASLFTHGGSDHRLKINKAAAGDTGSVLFQTNFSGRAEFGLTGDDNFHVKVSPNGSAWHEAIVINRSNGSVSFPNSALTYEAGSWTPTFAFGTPGDLSVSYTVQVGHYIAVGNLVWLYYRLDFTPTFTTASGVAQVLGVPFGASPTLAGGALSGHIAGFAYPAGRSFPVGRFADTSTIGLVAFGSGASSAAFNTSHLPSGTGQQIIQTLVYRR